MGWVDPTIRVVKEYKDSWIDKFRCKKIKFQKLNQKS